jgi:GDP-D-mannose dehydratase
MAKLYVHWMVVNYRESYPNQGQKQTGLVAQNRAGAVVPDDG